MNKTLNDLELEISKSKSLLETNNTNKSSKRQKKTHESKKFHLSGRKTDQKFNEYYKKHNYKQ